MSAGRHSSAGAWRRRTAAACAVAWAVMATGAAAMQDFSRYEIILQTMPFGDTRAAVAATTNAVAGPLPPSQSFVRNLRLVALRERGETVRVGLVDITAKPQPRAFWLYVGETSDDGIEILNADFEAGKALLRKNSDEQWLTLTSAGTAAPLSPPAVATSRVGFAPPQPSSAAAGSYLSRLRARQEALRTRVVQPPQLTGDALQRHLQSYNMQLIREGKPPLPIALTPDQDTQLVQEGVLPPQDGQGTAAPAPTPESAPQAE